MKISGIAYPLLAIMILLSSCNKGEQINISGTYQGERKDYLKFNRIEVDRSVFIDSARISKSGKFRFKTTNNVPEFYTIGFGSSELVTIIAYPGDNISLAFEGKKLHDRYQVTGSKESEDLRMLDLKLAKTLASLDSLTKKYNALPGSAEYDSERAKYEEAYMSVVEEQRMHNIKYIIEHLKSFSSIKALYQRLNENAYVLYRPTDAQYLKLVSDTLNKYYPRSKQAISLAQNLETEINNMRMNSLTALAAEVEGTDMDVELTSIEGKRIRLSSFRNKSYVLLTFWSAGSKECIANNIQLKEFYKRYRTRGFEIFQVNLDQDEGLWKQAVNFDELPWVNVREDDPENPVNAIKFNVTELPANYLLNKEGEIIGKNLFGRSLQIKLNQLFD